MTLPVQRDGGKLLLHSVMLAEYVKADSAGLVTILNGGIVRFGTASLPTQLGLGIAIQVSSLMDQHITVPLRIEISKPDGTGTVRLAGEMGLDAGSEYSNMAFNIPVPVDTEGRWTVEVSFGEGEPRADLWFTVGLD